MKYNTPQLIGLVILRVFIGWHLLYEGLTKLITPNWTSTGYLLDADWILAGWFQSIAESPNLLAIVDFLNIWLLILIGISLIAGLFTRTASYIGAVLLVLYFIANPPLVGMESSYPNEGSYLVINKTIIEAASLFILAVFPTGHIIGMDRFIKKMMFNTKSPGQ